MQGHKEVDASRWVVVSCHRHTWFFWQFGGAWLELLDCKVLRTLVTMMA